MPLNVYTKLDLIASDPTIIPAIQQTEDEYLTYTLGNDYSKYMQMRRDPNVRAMLGKRRQAVLGREFLITTLGKRIADRKAIARTTEVLNHIRYESICSSLLNTGQLIGFAVIRVDWVQEGNLILPRTQFVPQDRFGFVPPDPNNTTVPVATNERLDPKTEIVMVNGYELRLLTLRSPFSGERCPKGRFVVYTFDSDSAPGGLGLGYSIYPWWVVKREATKNWLLHITLAYFGRHQTFPQLEQTMTALRSLCNRTAPFTAQIGGWGRFNASESTDDMDVIYASPDMPGLIEFRRELLNVFENITGLSAKANHGYTPHITLAKVQPESAISVTLPTIAVQFNRLTLTHGNTHLTFPLQGEPEFSETIQSY
ncbi:phage portal protein family protein [Pantanalinema rosaneae CENA516]|uniref:2'-5' RNA ligase family protein n=1 Tax=Pantanalinema rosaneae TaxID=1620701 RepID=UPI003D6DAE81